MREKTNPIIEAFLKVFLVALLAFITSMILVGVFSQTDLKDFFLNLLGISITFFSAMFFAFIFLLFIFADSKTSYTADLVNVPKEFEDIYKTLYENYIVKLEGLRKTIKIRNIIGKILLGILILYVPVVNTFGIISPQITLISIFFALIFLGILIMLYKDNKADKFLYVQTYKKGVIENLLKMINPQVTYESGNSNKIDFYKRKYIDARFWLDIYDFNAEDFIEGEIDGCKVNISDVTVLKSTGKYKIIFEGIFAYVDYKHHVMPNVVISRKFLVGNKGETKVTFDNELFEQYFNVYSQNEMYARKLLNDGLLETVLKFRMKYNIDFDVSLINGKIYIKIYSFSIFEPEIFDKTNGKQDLYTHYCFSKFILDLINEVKIIVDRN